MASTSHSIEMEANPAVIRRLCDIVVNPSLRPVAALSFGNDTKTSFSFTDDMARKSIPVMEWAQTHHSVVFDDDYEPRHTTPPRRGPSDQRFRSLSMSLPWKRPKHSLFSHDEMRDLTHQMNDAAIDDSHDGPEHLYGSTHVKHRRASGSIKGIIRRASMSLKGIVHRRPSVAAADTIYEQGTTEERPITSNGPWNRLRQAASFRHSRSFHDWDMYRDPNQNIPVPGQGDEPPIIPHHSGAAAKASAAMQNEYFARQRWLNAPGSDDGNDRESGIGINVTRPSLDLDTDDEETVLEQDANISRIDFVSELPPELAIHILACLDASALAKASAVSRQWHRTIANQHIWRESCLRETTGTYATSRPVQPGTGMGVPKVHPSNDWKKIYQAKLELSQRWKEGKARPVYLNGHTDSIYCLQFDE